MTQYGLFIKERRRLVDDMLLIFLHHLIDESYSIDSILQGSEDEVSIFQFESKPGRENLLDNAKSSLKRLKTLRHPSILTYLHSSENEKMVCIVTEPVTPLSEYLRQAESFTKEQRNNAISYGLYQVAVSLDNNSSSFFLILNDHLDFF